MNPPNPLRPDALDELLSADIDGELARAARDRGLSADDARAAISTPEAVARRAELERARDLVAPVPPLDPAAVDRLVAEALTQADHEKQLAAAQRRRDRFDTMRRVTIGAAAAAAVFAGLALLVHAGGGSSESKSASTAGSAAHPTVPAPAPRSQNFGDVSTPGALRAAVLARVGAEHSTQRKLAAPLDAPQANLGPQGLTGAAGTTKQSGEFAAAPQGPRNATSAADSAVPERTKRADCVARLVRTGRVPPTPLLAGNGVAQGRPVYVVVFRSNGGYDVYVLSAGTCAVVRHTTVS